MSKQTVTPNRTVRTTTSTTRTPAGKAPVRPSATAARKATQAAKPFNMPFERKNLTLIIAGVLTIGLGYLIMWMSPTMSQMALTVAPIILLIGYCIVVPMGILAGTKTFRKQQPVTLGGEPTNPAA